jgi:hypothetical protein
MQPAQGRNVHRPNPATRSWIATSAGKGNGVRDRRRDVGELQPTLELRFDRPDSHVDVNFEFVVARLHERFAADDARLQHIGVVLSDRCNAIQSDGVQVRVVKPIGRERKGVATSPR